MNYKVVLQKSDEGYSVSCPAYPVVGHRAKQNN